MRRRRWRVGLIGLVVVTVISGGAAWVWLRNGAETSGPVEVSGSNLPTGFSAAEAPNPDPLAQAYLAASGAWDLEPAGALPAATTVTLPLAAPAPSAASVVVVGREKVDGPAEYFPATVTTDGAHVSFSTTHFSIYQALFVRPLQGLDAQLREAFDTVTGNFDATAGPPHCDNDEAQHPDGYTVSSTRSDAVYWCLGVENGRHILKIVNNRRYALEAHHGTMATLNPGLDDALDRTTSDIEPRKELRLDATQPGGGAARVAIEYGGLADAKYQLLLGLSTAATFLELGPEKLAGLQKVVNDAVAAGGCLKDVADDKFQNFADIVASCMTPEQLVAVFGTAGALLVPVIQTGALVNYFRSRANLAADLTNGRARYNIVVSRSGNNPVPAGSGPSTPTEPTPVLGWAGWAPGVIGFGTSRPLEINANGDGTSYVNNVRWATWGGPQATGTGTAAYVPPTAPDNSYATPAAAQVIASDLGPCHGRLAYRKIGWYFPEHGETATNSEVAGFDHICDAY